MTHDEQAQRVDFGQRSQDYAEYRPGFPPSFYARLEAMAGFDGRRVVDLATGPGVIALELAKRGAEVVGIDVAKNQIQTAREQARSAGVMDHCTFRVAAAEESGLEGASFDWVVAGQCWHWFEQQNTLSEVRRLLKPSGRLVIAHYSYLTSQSEVARLSEELVLRHNPSWKMANSSGMYPEQIEQVLSAGFEAVEQFCDHHDQRFTRESWRGRMRTCNGVGSRHVPEEAVDAYDHDLDQLLRDRFDDSFTVPHRVWAVIAKRPGSSS